MSNLQPAIIAAIGAIINVLVVVWPDVAPYKQAILGAATTVITVGFLVAHAAHAKAKAQLAYARSLEKVAAATPPPPGSPLRPVS